MHALTIWQPYASLAVRGVKRHETRSWRPPPGLVGEDAPRIAIHAAQRIVEPWEPGEPPPAGCSQATVDAVFELWGWAAWSGKRHLSPLPYGAVVGFARIVAVHETDGRELDPHGDYSPGRFAWELGDVQELAAPQAARGAQRLWQWLPELCPVHHDHDGGDFCGAW